VTDNKSAINPLDDFDVHCVSAGLEGLTHEKRQIICEQPLTIEVEQVGSYTIMCTPGDEIALALGFAFTEGLIDSSDDVNVLIKCPDNPHTVRMQLVNPPDKKADVRNMLVVSSCGICGDKDINKKIASLPILDESLHITVAQLTELPGLLRKRQELFRATGGTHAAGIFYEGEFLTVCEDLGRHTAFDKAIGTCLLKKIVTRGTASVLSGRVSFEMLAKAARAGIELIAAVSAPTTLAIKAAQRCNITLCGFVRDGRATIYTHPQRIS
jgi:FdhD protein